MDIVSRVPSAALFVSVQKTERPYRPIFQNLAFDEDECKHEYETQASTIQCTHKLINHYHLQTVSGTVR